MRSEMIVRRIAALRGGAASPTQRRLVLAVAAMGLVVGAYVAWTSRPDVPTDPKPWLLVIAALLVVPVHVALNGAELLVMARIGRTRMAIGEAARVTVVSSAANLLPIPGAVIIRTRALQRLGSTGRHALSVTIVVGIGWVSTACALAGVLLLVSDPTRTGLAFAAVGMVGLIATWLLLQRYPARRGPAFAGLVGVEMASTLIGGARVYLAILGLGYDVSFPAGVALSLAGPLASLVGIFPGGLGLREGIAAALAPLVGLPAAVALLATIVDRLLGAIVQAALSLALLFAPVRDRVTNLADAATDDAPQGRAT